MRKAIHLTILSLLLNLGCQKDSEEPKNVVEVSTSTTTSSDETSDESTSSLEVSSNFPPEEVCNHTLNIISKEVGDDVFSEKEKSEFLKGCISDFASEVDTETYGKYAQCVLSSQKTDTLLKCNNEEGPSESEEPPTEERKPEPVSPEWATEMASKKMVKQVKDEETKLTLVRSNLAKNWNFDRTGYTYFSREANKGSLYWSLDLNISSQEENPKIPEVFVCFILLGEEEEKESFLCINMTTKFYKWEDYGTYLGNYHDSKNDFSKTETVRFTVGFPLEKDWIEENGIFAVVKPSCQVKTEDRSQNPPVSYVSECEPPTLEEVLSLPMIGSPNVKVLKKTFSRIQKVE